MANTPARNRAAPCGGRGKRNDVNTQLQTLLVIAAVAFSSADVRGKSAEQPATSKDGSSPAKPIMVSGVNEESEYIQKHFGNVSELREPSRAYKRGLDIERVSFTT